MGSDRRWRVGAFQSALEQKRSSVQRKKAAARKKKAGLIGRLINLFKGGR